MAFGSILEIADAVVGCQRCQRLRRYCRQVARAKVRRFQREEYWGRPVPGFGDPAARLLVVGLAPAAHGANRTGRMFTGDSSGEWLYQALHRYGFATQPRSVGIDDGLLLRECYVTAAGRCAPPANKPLPAELDRCREFLTAEIEVLRRVQVVVALGRIAHDAYLKASGRWETLGPRGRPRFGHGEERTFEDGVHLLASYHPSRQNTNTGRLTGPMWHRIFERARELA